MPISKFLELCPSLTREDTSKYTLADIEKEVKEVCNYIDVAYPYSGKKMSSVYFNVRWGMDKTGTLGRCHRSNEMMYDLIFNPTYFKVSNPTEVHSTIIHEVLHACKGGMKHTGNWKMMANNCQYHLGIPVKRTGSDPKYTEVRNTTFKYYVECQACGWKGERRRKLTPNLKNIMNNNRRGNYCPTCKSKDLKVKKF